MSSLLETLTLKELYTRKKNLIYQLEKVDNEIKQRILENGPEFHIEIAPYENTEIEPNKKIIIKKKVDNNNIIEIPLDNNVLENNVKDNTILEYKVLQNNDTNNDTNNNNETKIIRKIHIKIKK